ncbi:hypothetical protein FKM82_029209 [Ascaphus truei]
MKGFKITKRVGAHFYFCQLRRSDLLTLRTLPAPTWRWSERWITRRLHLHRRSRLRQASRRRTLSGQQLCHSGCHASPKRV